MVGLVGFETGTRPRLRVRSLGTAPLQTSQGAPVVNQSKIIYEGGRAPSTDFYHPAGSVLLSNNFAKDLAASLARMRLLLFCIAIIFICSGLCAVGF